MTFSKESVTCLYDTSTAVERPMRANARGEGVVECPFDPKITLH